jgi:hypothetical protein
MPAKPTWFLRIPRMIETLQASSVPFLDRAAIEALFELQRRQAINLMHRLGGYQIGKAFVVDRARVEAWLQNLGAPASLSWERKRRKRVGEAIARAQSDLAARQVPIRVPRETAFQTIAGLSSEISLRPGELRIEFRDAEDLLSKLFELAKAIGNDFEGFNRRIS